MTGRRESMRPVLSLLLAALFCASAAAASIEVTVEPDRCYLGGEILIRGWVKPGARGPATVKLEIQPPAPGKKVTESLRSHSDGHFEFSFSDTRRAGEWRVTALKQGSGDRARSRFVVAASLFLAPMVDHLDEHNRLSRQAVDYLIGQLAQYPDFAGKQEMLKDSRALQRRLDDLQRQLDRLETESDRLEDRLRSDPEGIPEAAAAALRTAAQRTVRVSDYLAAETARAEKMFEQSKQETRWCHEWKRYHDLMKRLNMICNFAATSIEEVAVNLLTARGTRGLDYATAQAIGTVSNIIGAAVMGASVVGILTFAASTFTGLSAAMFQELLNAFCTLYEGELEGSYKAELLHRDMPFFTQSYRLKGTVSLVFEKRDPGDPAVYLKGDLEARADDFACTMTMIPFELPTATVLSGCLPALPVLASRSAALRLEGEARADRLTLRPAGVDGDYTLKARAYYVIIGAHSPLPVPGVLEFPLMDGEWFFTRVTRLSQPDKDELVIPITVQSSKSVAEKSWNREIYLPATPNRKAVRVTMSLKLTLNN